MARRDAITREQDEFTLEVLDWIYNRNCTPTSVARHLGVTKNVVIWISNRFREYIE